MKSNDIDALFSAARSGNKKQMSAVGNAAVEKLTDEQKRKVERAMNDPEYLRSILSTPGAQEIIKRLKED